MAVTPLPAGQAQLPRIVSLIGALALLVWVNRSAPRILPALLGLVVLYVALTNVSRSESLIAGAQASLAGLVHPSTPPARAAGGGRPPLLR